MRQTVSIAGGILSIRDQPDMVPSHITTAKARLAWPINANMSEKNLGVELRFTHSLIILPRRPIAARDRYGVCDQTPDCENEYLVQTRGLGIGALVCGHGTWTNRTALVMAHHNGTKLCLCSDAS